MYAVLTLFCITFAGFLFLNGKVNRPYKKISTRFAAMFFICAVTLGSISVQQHKDTLLQVFHPDDQRDTVFAEMDFSYSEEDRGNTLENYLVDTSKQLDAPIIEQYPELPRGCEVTALAMLLNYHDYEVDKLKLASEVAKDSTDYEVIDGEIHFGNPNNGFVGDMYSLNNPGYGVYHEPIEELARSYAGDRVENLTEQPFESVIASIHNDEPVFVITNASYAPLPDNQFETWQTSDGPVEITMRLHAVVVTGYDSDYIYFNDPLQPEINKAPIDEFIGAWVQMGKQAITIQKS
ncbi:C39 family peptidase [Halalkalibacillus halophilus]|uniref:C39 family peptidase n=1 Tax=Halalkalibacillus halophilus TaxID=392827 RepID=UPI000687B8F9|nr:C39 family peptidase [Halalkalibacillus halophilus]